MPFNIAQNYPNSSSTGTQEVRFGQNDFHSFSAWGEGMVSQAYSLARGYFTFGIPSQVYGKYRNGTEVFNGGSFPEITISRGRLSITATDGDKNVMRSYRCYQYQPDRGHRYISSAFIPNATSGGKLYHVLRTKYTDTVEESRTEIDTTGIDLTKGNLFDFKFQWRGVGDYQFFINLEQASITSDLGSRSDLSIANPTMPVFFEAQQGGHTFGGVERTGSCVRWGLGTEENGVYYEYEYEDTANPLLYIGCFDLTVEGGSDKTTYYDSVTTGEILSNDGEQPALVMRLPLTRDVNGEDWINTVGVRFFDATVSQDDENIFRIYLTRDPSAVSVTAGDWTPSPLTSGVEYAINDDSDAGRTFTFNNANALLVYSSRFEVDQPFQVVVSDDVRLAPGDYIVFTCQTAGADEVFVTTSFGAELL
jgi:hypothetical protein